MSLKNYIGLINDHSASMGHITQAALRDYNANIATIREEAIAKQQDTLVSVMKCGTGSPARNVFSIQMSSVFGLKPESNYVADGTATPLWDAVGDMINHFKRVPDVNNEEVSFAVIVTTDGQNNRQIAWTAQALSQEIKRLQMTDRWTFVFRVPAGAKRDLVAYGIPEHNIMEWEQSEKGVEVATVATTAGLRSYFNARDTGAKSVGTFYSDISSLTKKEVKAVLDDVSDEVDIWTVLSREDGEEIKPFVEKRLRRGVYTPGAAFYQLSKTERRVQDYKKIVIRDKANGKLYSGHEARDMLGLPATGDVRLVPKDHGTKFDVFIQSTSINRKLVGGTNVLYWPKAA